MSYVVVFVTNGWKWGQIIRVGKGKEKGLATTYSHAAVHGTTIGSKRLNERVRNGNVCFPRAYDHQAKYLTRNGTLKGATPGIII